MEDQETDLVAELGNNPNKALERLYKNYRKEFLSWSYKRFGASEADALDCFQDAIIVFYRNAVDGKTIALSSSTKTYLFSIGRNMLFRKFKKGKHEVHFENPMDGIGESADFEYRELYEGNEVENKVAGIVKKMKDPCKSIIRYFYFRGFTMEEIAGKMDYKNAQTVKAQKVRCIKEIQSQVEQQVQMET